MSICDISSLSLTCKYLRQHINQDSVWKYLYLRDSKAIGDKEAIFAGSSITSGQWKSQFIKFRTKSVTRIQFQKYRKLSELSKFSAKYYSLDDVMKIQHAAKCFINRKRFKERLEMYRNRRSCAQELVDTEITYVNTISLLLNHFLLPLKEISSIKNLISGMEIEKMVFGAEAILSINQELLTNLEDRMNHWNPESLIGDVFLDLVKKIFVDSLIFFSQSANFKLYTSYVSNYFHAMTLLKYTASRDLELWISDKEQHISPKNLEDLMICPVQRIPRYSLLLEKLLKNTPIAHKDYKLISESLRRIRETASYVNEKMKVEYFTPYFFRTNSH